MAAVALHTDNKLRVSVSRAGECAAMVVTTSNAPAQEQGLQLSAVKHDRAGIMELQQGCGSILYIRGLLRQHAYQ